MNTRPPAPDSSAPRPSLGVRFECCGVYTRVYRRPDEMCYRLRCPRCLRATVVRVDPSGQSTRFVIAQ